MMFVTAWSVNMVAIEIFRLVVIAPAGVIVQKMMAMMVPIKPRTVLTIGAKTTINRRPHTTQSR
jgi:hypothetical protein